MLGNNAETQRFLSLFTWICRVFARASLPPPYVPLIDYCGASWCLSCLCVLGMMQELACISHQHCSIVFDKARGGFMLLNRGALGTWVDGRHVMEEAAPLHTGSKIEIGSATFVFSAEDLSADMR